MTRVRPDGQKELVERFRQDMTRLLRPIDGVPAALRSRPISGERKLNDVVAHVAAWDRELVRAVDQLLAGVGYTYLGETYDAGHAAEIEAGASGGPP
jgi:hypothetical protein